MREHTFVDSLNQALHQICAADPTVYILGEDILDPYGGAFKVTRGLSTRFPDRIFTTPISESALVGLAGGMALRGLRPIVEIMFGDFMTLCADQIINHIAKYWVMYAGQVEVPVVIRTPMGGGRSYGPTHSQSLEKLFFGVPYLKVVAPSCFHNPGNLLKTAVADPEPVIFIEHKLLYPAPLIAPGKAPAPLRLEWWGSKVYPTAVLTNYDVGQSDVTLITYGGSSRNLEQLLVRLAEDELRVLCLLPSLLNRLNLTIMTKALSIATAGCVIWEEGTSDFNWSAEIIALLNNKLGNTLCSIKRLASLPTVIPAARHLEQNVIPGIDVVEQAIVELTTESMMR